MNVKYPRGHDALPAELNEYFEAFFAADSKREPGQDTYDDIFTSPILFPLQRQRELAWMMQKARHIAPRVVYEIGADKAGGLYHWCKSLPTVERVICCEIRGTPYRDLFEANFPSIDFLWLPESSYLPPALAKVAAWLGNDTIDCLFIDGDKSYFDRDFFVHYSMMNPDGIVFMHDIQDESTRAGYDKVIARGFAHEEYINITESHEAMAREREGIEVASTYEQWLRHWKGSSAGVGMIPLSGGAV